MFVRPTTLGALLLLAGACASPSIPAAPGAPAPAPAPAPLPQAQQQAAPSALSYGLVTSQVRKGETTQLDLLQLFGSPNISSFDSAGIETWVYEKTVTQTDVQSQTQTAKGAANLGLFFNQATLGGGVSGSQSASTGSSTTSVRSITVIVKFAENRTVSDYSVRASYF